MTITKEHLNTELEFLMQIGTCCNSTPRTHPGCLDHPSHAVLCIIKSNIHVFKVSCSTLTDLGNEAEVSFTC